MKKATAVTAALSLSAAAAALALAGAHAFYRRVYTVPSGKRSRGGFSPIPALGEEERAQTRALIAALDERPFERVSILSFDGLRLNGRLYHTRDGAPLAILCHGWQGTPTRDFCGGANACFDMGFNVLLIEQRAHCSSEGRATTLGVNERLDCLAWCRYAESRFGTDTPVLLVGISMGAAAVLMASELALPENVRGIVADCPFTSPEAILRSIGEAHAAPVRLIMPLARLGARVFGGFSLVGQANAAEAVRHARVPILLIHGEADDLVPCAMSREIAAANPALVELHTFPGAGHGLSYLADTQRYTRILRAFCARVLNEG